MSGAARFPWQRLMSAGLGALGLSPAAFWAATPRELNAALGRFRAQTHPRMARRDLLSLMESYPDHD